MAAIDAAAPEPVDGTDRAGRCRGGRRRARAARRRVRAACGGARRQGQQRQRRPVGRPPTRADAACRTLVLDAKRRFPTRVPACDLVIDAAYGTGFRGEFRAPIVPPGTPVLAVDIPSGVAGLTGQDRWSPLAADRTVTFAAIKPGLLFGPGAPLAGEIVVADIGLDRSAPARPGQRATTWPRGCPARPRRRPQVERGGARRGRLPGDVGGRALGGREPRSGRGRAWSASARRAVPIPPDHRGRRPEPARRRMGRWRHRCGRPLQGDRGGPGPRARSAEVGRDVADLLRRTSVPAVVDGDGLTVLGAGRGGVLAGRSAPVVLTPHEGEFVALTGAAPGPIAWRPSGPSRRRPARWCC